MSETKQMSMVEPHTPKRPGSSWPYGAAAVVLALFSLFFLGVYGHMHWKVVFETPSPGVLDAERAARASHVLDLIGYGYRALALGAVVFGTFAATRKPAIVGVIALVAALVTATLAFAVVT